ncbi:APC family permease [Nocardioides dubius]|uniref:APC family permease n=1 Tax=Nocardioides dubius TaxID=317019 RepID=A0ABP4E8N1_9ACTN
MSTSAREEPAAQDTGSDKGLSGNTLSFAGTLVIGLASVAPAYSLAATLGYVVIATGVLAPVAVILGFIPMLLTAFAYRELNKVIPDCGTTFTWVTKAFGPRTGWFSGWVLAMAGIIVLANLAQVAAQYTFLLFNADDLADSTFWVTFLGVVFIATMTWVSYRGIEIANWLQNVLVGIQYVALAILVVVAFIAIFGSDWPDTSIDISASWFNPWEFFADGGGGWAALTEGMLLMIFIYWGWDTILSLNEETKDKGRTPGRAAIAATLILLATYLLTTLAAVSYAGVGTTGIGLGNEANADDVFSAIGQPVLGDWDWIVLLAVLVSAVASTQTTILPAARGTLAMGVYRAIQSQFAKVHPRFATPSFSTFAIGATAIAIYVGLSLMGENVYGDVLLAIGLMIAFYYGITAYACVWYFRSDILKGGKDLWIKGILPLTGALILTFAFIKSAKDMLAADYGYVGAWTVPGLGWEIGSVFLFGMGTILLGLPVMFLLARRSEQKPFFHGDTLHHDTPVKAPE